MRFRTVMITLAAGCLVACNVPSDTDQESAGRQSEPAAAAPETTTSTVATETSLPAIAPPTNEQLPDSRTTVEPEAASTELLAKSEQQKIINVTGFENLAKHELREVQRVALKNVDVVAISMDGAELTIPINELIADVNMAEELAEQRLSFETTMTLGPGDTRLLAFKTFPTQEIESGRDTRYFIFGSEGQSLAEATASSIPSPDAFTYRFSEQNMSVSVLKAHPGLQHHGGVSADSTWAATEAIMAATNAALDSDSEYYDLDEPYSAGTLDLSYIEKPDYPSDYFWKKAILGDFAMEVYANSEALALVHAQDGATYQKYKTIDGTKLGLYSEVGLEYFAVGAKRYQDFQKA